jgi:hypothetical protein
LYVSLNIVAFERSYDRLALRFGHSKFSRESAEADIEVKAQRREAFMLSLDVEAG